MSIATSNKCLTSSNKESLLVTSALLVVTRFALLGTSPSLLVTSALLVVTRFASSNKCHASSNKCLTSSNKVRY